MRFSSTTAKWPAQSSRASNAPKAFRATLDGDDSKTRNSTDARGRRQPEPKCQFAEIVVECDDQSRISLRSSQHRGITEPGRICANPNHIVPGGPERFDGLSRKVLIGQNAHFQT